MFRPSSIWSFYEDDVNALKTYSHKSTVNVLKVTTLLNKLSLGKMKSFKLIEKQLRIFTGLASKNLCEQRDMFRSMKNTDNRTIMQALMVFLFEMRTGNSNKLIAAVLQLEREQLVSEHCQAVVDSFEKDILVMNFGLATVNREDLIRNYIIYAAKQLYNAEGKLMLMLEYQV